MIDSDILGITQIITADINMNSYEDIIIAHKYNYDRVSFFINQEV